ncbi:MAG: phospholipid carrier-dependent glycosyltransferase [Planctomycetota bacterium]|jgi:hypothetical protein
MAARDAARPATVTGPRGTLSRRGAAWIVLGITVAAFCLRVLRLRHGLPYVFHSDALHADQAVLLLKHGWFTDAYDYPLPMVYVYAAAAWLAFTLQRLVTDAPWLLDWPTYVEHFARPEVHHAVLRLFTVTTGALLVPAVYRLGRVRCGRGVALLAATVVAVDPAHVLSSIQVRPHVPVVTLIVLAAIPLLRLVARGPETRPRPSLAMRAGLLLGVAGALFQLGLIAFAWAVLLLLAALRPAKRWLREGVVFVVVFGLSYAALTWAAERPDIAREPPGAQLGEGGTLSMPARIAAWGFAGRFHEYAGSWVAAAPTLTLGVLAFLAACALRRRPGRDLVLYIGYPLAVLLVMGLLVGAHVRYLLAALPFLAVLAASGVLAWRPPGGRFAYAALFVLVPLTATLHAMLLLGTSDTRVALAGLLERATLGTGADGLPAATPPLAVALQDRLVIDRSALPPGVSEFPRHGGLASWAGEDGAPSARLRESGAEVYARVPRFGWANGPLDAATLTRLGFTLWGRFDSAPTSRLYLPDLPDDMFPGLWRTTRTGPPIEIWCASERARARLSALTPPDALDAWMHGPTAAGRAIAAAAASAGAGAGGSVAIDLDGDGVEERVATSVPATMLTKLLALPAERWHDAGHALAPSDSAAGAPALSARGTLLPDEPVLLLLRGARPHANAQLVCGLTALRSPFAGGSLVPAPDVVVSGLPTGPEGHLALGGLWPLGMPARQDIWLQVWVRDPDGPHGYVASNALQATTPD